MIGSARHRVKVERQTQVQTPIGVEEVWDQVGEDWASIVVLSQEARLRFQQAGSTAPKWRLVFRQDPRRHAPDLGYGTLRFRWNDRYMYPTGEVENPDTRGRRFHVHAEEGPDGN